MLNLINVHPSASSFSQKQVHGDGLSQFMHYSQNKMQVGSISIIIVWTKRKDINFLETCELFAEDVYSSSEYIAHLKGNSAL